MSAQVHASHCCLSHGCKYGDKNCPVTTGAIKQLYPCEECYEGESPSSIEDKARELFENAIITKGTFDEPQGEQDLLLKSACLSIARYEQNK
ncbi:hypothetical protein [Photobacterium damselae]|uniref:hypothetical protein n=1 Tax=Photobacterium damselae TaxID=38293 RepID=UPI0040681B60